MPDASIDVTTRWAENFEQQSVSPVVGGWVDTRENNSMSPDDSLFEVVDLNGNRVFGTTSSATNIHSHYLTLESVDWSGYEFRGRMLITDPTGGIGVTVHSQYNDSDAYYRLRRFNSGTFHMAPHPDATPLSCESRATSVAPSANRWYRFRFEVLPTADATTLRAKVWPDGSAEPDAWQVRCQDTLDDRLTAGTVGLWSMGPGAKYWDDLEVVEPGNTTTTTDTPVGSGTSEGDSGGTSGGSSSDTNSTTSGSSASGGSTAGSTSGDTGSSSSGSSGSESAPEASTDVATRWAEDFEQQSISPVVGGWVDTRAGNSMSPDDSLFKVVELNGNRVFGTTSSATNIHSHYLTLESVDWSGYEFRGRMMVTDRSGGIGVTVHSQYNDSDAYYRLRRFNSGTFHMAPHPDDTPLSCESRATSVAPSANRWYRFRFEVVPTADATTLRAKVWPEGSAEPDLWQVRCQDTLDDRLTAGTVGLWSMGPGAKYWDDLEVVEPTR